jgi:hypothetical protein
MTDPKFFEEDFHIDEILLEADAFGLSHEVDTYAKKILNERPGISRVEAYERAYQEWIK